MTKRSQFYIPAQGTAARLAAEYLFKNGPATEAEIYIAVDFGCAPSKRAEKLQRAVGTGVLTQRDDGKLDCSAAIRAYFDKKTSDSEGAEPIGQIAPAQYRQNVFASPGLSKKYIPNRRGPRVDVPAWSVKPDGYSIKSA
jgi:hypothetical protein